jgi:acetyltransferase-like isoleucine patch superfamily enzyme
MNDSAEPEYFGCGMSVDDRPPVLEAGVRIGAFTALGRQAYPTAANRRPTRLVEAGHIGSGTVIGCQCVIYAGVFIGRECCIGDHVVIREDTNIGDRCVLGTKVDIQYGVRIANDVRLLNETQIAGGTVIGEGSFLAQGVTMANDPHLFNFDLGDYRDRGQTGPVIGRHVKIGPGAILLPGVVIGDEAIIGAGALVTRDVAPGAKMFGLPARPVAAAEGYVVTVPLDPNYVVA